MQSNPSMTMEEYLKAHEFLRETAQLHQAMDEAVRQLATPLAIGAEAAKEQAAGVPLLQGEPWKQEVVAAAAKLLPRVLEEMKGIPAPPPMQQGIASLLAYAQGEAQVPHGLFSFFDLLLRQEQAGFSGLCAEAGLGEPLARTVGWRLLGALVPEEVKQPALWEQAGWKENYCPVCGRPPVMAQLKKENDGRARYLSCGGCGTLWRYKRVGCAYCGNEDLKKMHILEPENEPHMRLDVCDECHAYLKTYGADGAEDIYLRDWATVHLDLLGEEKGLCKKGSILLA